MRKTIKPGHPHITEKNTKKGTGETAAPNAGTQPYALDELARTQEVGAALSSALSRFDALVKQNPDNLVRQESGRCRKSSLPGRQSGTPGSVVA